MARETAFEKEFKHSTSLSEERYLELVLVLGWVLIITLYPDQMWIQISISMIGLEIFCQLQHLDKGKRYFFMTNLRHLYLGIGPRFLTEVI